jgi:hypothetical protein
VVESQVREGALDAVRERFAEKSAHFDHAGQQFATLRDELLQASGRRR